MPQRILSFPVETAPACFFAKRPNGYILIRRRRTGASPTIFSSFTDGGTRQYAFQKNLRCFWSAPKTSDLMERRYGTESGARAELRAKHVTGDRWQDAAVRLRMVCGQC
ncbi:uncharacterized [Tachysurus ichikawai]